MAHVRRLIVSLLLMASFAGFAQRSPDSSPIATDDHVIAIEHVQELDGTAADAAQDQLVILKNGHIESVGAFSAAAIPSSAHVIDGKGKTLIPGLVGMHEHLFFPTSDPSRNFLNLSHSFPRLYLASGVTTACTTGSIEPYTDINVKASIDSGKTQVQGSN